MADAPEPVDPEAEGETGRLARWAERGRVLQARVEEARGEHSSVDFGLGLVERDASIGGALLAGALAYRLFVLLLPTSLLLVTGLGLYADTVDKSTKTVTKEAGLSGLIGSQVAEAAAGRHRALVFVLMIPAVAYALATLYRALAKVHALAWSGSARGVRTTPRGVAALAAAFTVQLVATEVVSWIRRGHPYEGVLALLAYLVLIGGAWLVVSVQLPHGGCHWTRLIPGAALFGVGLFFVHAFNVYVTTRLVEGRANTYGALGIATALLFSLVLVGRLMLTSAELNAAVDERRTGHHAAVPDRS